MGEFRPCKTTTRFVILLTSLCRTLFGGSSTKRRAIGCDLGERHGQVGSLAGAVHLLNSNTGVLR